MLIKSPLWILNSILVAVCTCIIFFMLITREGLPARKTLRYNVSPIAHTKEISHVDLARIYENDLFNTYNKAVPKVVEIPRTLPLPTPPQPVPLPITPEAKPQFLEPLPITLKGVIFTLREQDNRAIIADNKSKKENLYKTGDIVEDAELIHIGRNNAIFIRSNGQQETLFLTPGDAHRDPQFKEDDSWALTIKKLSDSLYTIDTKAFTERVTNLAQFIDLLDLTTAFERGKSVGCRIGSIAPNSLGAVLGLMTNDIITTINTITPTSTKERVSIYNTIKKSNPGDTITITLLRNKEPHTISYKLIVAEKKRRESFPLNTQVIQETIVQEKTPEQQEPALSLVAHSDRLASAIQKDKRQSQLAMKNFGGRNAVLQKIPS